MAGTRVTKAKRAKAAALRCAGLTQEAAAAEAGIGVRSIERWEGNPGDAEYWAMWEEARQALLKKAFAEAYLVLRQELRRAEKPGDRIRAADIIVRALERTQASRHILTGEDGGPVETTTTVSFGDVLAEMKKQYQDGDWDPEAEEAGDTVG